MRAAVAGVTCLPFLRLFGQMRCQFWLDDGVAGLAMSDLSIGQDQQHPLTWPGGAEERAIFEGHLRGAQVAPVAALSTEARLELLLAELEKSTPARAVTTRAVSASPGSMTPGLATACPGMRRAKSNASK